MVRKFFSVLLLLCAYVFGNIIAAASLQPIQEVFVQSDQAKLFCRRIGKGKPLVILHGGPGLTQDYLLPQLYQLAEDNFLIFYDQRGCGQSTGEIHPETINMETFVHDLENIRKAFNFEKISILGHSWGAFLAMHYAIKHPESVDKLILSNSMPASSEGFSLFHNEWLRRTAPYQEEISLICNTKGFEEGDPELVACFYRTIFQTYCYEPEKADLLNLYMPSIASVNGTKVYNLFRQNVFDKPFNLYQSLKTLKMPTLVIHGDVDPIPSMTAQCIHVSIPHSQFILMQHCGHFPYVEKPETYFRDLKEFLK